METTTIRIDRETKARLEKLSANSPLARYLRNLSLILDGAPSRSVEQRLDNIERILMEREKREPSTNNTADLIIDTRMLAQKLHYSPQRMATLDIFLSKASLETVRFINCDLREKLEHPELTLKDLKQTWIKDIADKIGSTPEDVKALLEKVGSLDDDSLKAFIKVAKEYRE